VGPWCDVTARAGRVVARRVAWHRVAVPPWVVGARAVLLGVVVALCLAVAACSSADDSEGDAAVRRTEPRRVDLAVAPVAGPVIDEREDVREPGEAALLRGRTGRNGARAWRFPTAGSSRQQGH
jgi:hypothetical protein